ncbi:hypothetical protein FACS1894132_00450 [Clostridia bacterium]|nr:hypothetical protein FACS1894132_00450 [Clostridia bacterium]
MKKLLCLLLSSLLLTSLMPIYGEDSYLDDNYYDYAVGWDYIFYVDINSDYVPKLDDFSDKWVSHNNYHNNFIINKINKYPDSSKYYIKAGYGEIYPENTSYMYLGLLEPPIDKVNDFAQMLYEKPNVNAVYVWSGNYWINYPYRASIEIVYFGNYAETYDEFGDSEKPSLPIYGIFEDATLVEKLKANKSEKIKTPTISNLVICSKYINDTVTPSKEDAYAYDLNSDGLVNGVDFSLLKRKLISQFTG